MAQGPFIRLVSRSLSHLSGVFAGITSEIKLHVNLFLPGTYWQKQYETSQAIGNWPSRPDPQQTSYLFMMKSRG